MAGANFRKMDSAVTVLEGKKVQVSVGNVREVRSKMIEFMADEIVEQALANGYRTVTSAGSASLVLLEEKVEALATKKLQKALKARV